MKGLDWDRFLIQSTSALIINYYEKPFTLKEMNDFVLELLKHYGKKASRKEIMRMLSDIETIFVDTRDVIREYKDDFTIKA